MNPHPRVALTIGAGVLSMLGTLPFMKSAYADDGRQPLEPLPPPALAPQPPPPGADSTPPAAPAGTTTVTSASTVPPYTAEPRVAEQDAVLIGGSVHHGLYGGPEAKMTSFTGEAAMLVGGDIGWLINKHYLVGLGGYGLATSHSPSPEISPSTGPSRIGFGYGGVRLGYVFRPEKILHASFGALIGAGGVTAMTRERTYDAQDNDYTERWDGHHGAAFFVAEPQTDLELNLHAHVRLAMTAGYRFVTSTEYVGFKSSDLSGPAIGLALRAGTF